GLFEAQIHVARHGLNEPAPALRAHWAGIDAGKADVVLAILAGERQRQILSRRIGGARRDLPVGYLDAVVADDVDDAPLLLLLHDRQNVLHAAYIAHE